MALGLPQEHQQDPGAEHPEAERAPHEAAELARANGIPIDVMPIRYEYENEVLIESLKVPTRARLGQTADLRIFFRSQRPVTGRLQVTQNDVPIILDPEAGTTAVRGETEMRKGDKGRWK